MVAENNPEGRIKTTLLFPNKPYLSELLHKDDLPRGAYELIEEAIAEIDSAFGGNFKEGSRREGVNTKIVSTLGEEEDRLLAGRVHVLTVQFGQAVKTLDEIFTHVAVVVHPRNMEDVRFYPQLIRWPAIDVNGNSKPTRFIMDIPDSQRGSDSGFSVMVFNGASLNADLPFNFRIV